jgi:CelD/BcsL family acetyltransferase involved in cellulose biosynthesis
MASGGMGAADYLDFLYEPPFEAAFLDEVFAILSKEKSRWQFFDWQGLHARVSLAQLTLSARRAGLFVLHEPWAVCYAAILASTWDEHLTKLSKNLRIDLGNRERKILRECNAEFLQVVDQQTLSEGIYALQRLQALRFGADAHGNPARFFEFIRLLAPQMLERGWLDLRLLRADGEYVAASLTFILNKTAFAYLTSCDVSERWSRYSVGTLIIADAVRSAITRRCTTFDMLRGEHWYKERFLGVRQQSKRVVFTSSRFGIEYFRARWWARDLQRYGKNLYHSGFRKIG